MNLGDRVPVVFRMYDANGVCIQSEQQVLPLIKLVTTIFAYSLTKPDACVRMTVDIAYPEWR